MKTSLLRDPPKSMKKTERQALLKQVLSRFEEENPNPHCELYYETPYQLLLSVVLSAQATDKSVNAAMEGLYKKGLSPADILKWKEEGVYDRIKTIGLAKTKSKNVYKLTKIFVDDFQNNLPRDRDKLESLPGVGPKTASVVLGELFGEPTLAVDTHVFRVARRLGFHKEKTPIKAGDVLLKQIPRNYLPRAHHWFVLHGRYICKALRPQCETCLLKDLCPSLK